MKTLMLIPLLLCGCSISKFNKPPAWASSVQSHQRVTGLDASFPIGGGASVGIKFGWISTVYSVIPVSTNRVYSAPISDTFKMSEGSYPWDVQITEDVQSGFDPDNVPTPRLIFKQPLK